MSVSVCSSVIASFGSALRMTSRRRIERNRAIGDLPGREVDLRLAHALQPAETDVAGDADDLAVGKREREVAADGILVRPVALHERFADDGDKLAIAAVRFADVPAAHDRNRQRVEVPGGDVSDGRDIPGASNILSGVGIALHRHRPHAAAESRNRHEAHEAGRSHARQGTHLLQHARIERLASHDLAVLRHRQLRPHGQHAVRLEAGIDALHG
jgi:hypothetical protein